MRSQAGAWSRSEVEVFAITVTDSQELWRLLDSRFHLPPVPPRTGRWFGASEISELSAILCFGRFTKKKIESAGLSILFNLLIPFLPISLDEPTPEAAVFLACERVYSHLQFFDSSHVLRSFHKFGGHNTNNSRPHQGTAPRARIAHPSSLGWKPEPA
jgi:hypothetical protein